MIANAKNKNIHGKLQSSRGMLSGLVFNMLDNQHPLRTRLAYPFASRLDQHYDYHENPKQKRDAVQTS